MLFSFNKKHPYMCTNSSRRLTFTNKTINTPEETEATYTFDDREFFMVSGTADVVNMVMLAVISSEILV